MRRRLALVLALVVTGTLAPLTTAPADPGSDVWTPTPAGWLTGPLEHVATIEEEVGASAVDAVVLDDRLYLTTWKGFSIYDVSDPAAPRRLVTRDVGPHLYNEQPQTNGEILLLSSDMSYGGALFGDAVSGGNALDVYDVSDPADPRRIARFRPHQWDHLWTCVLDCTYAYSATGTILDLTDPADPQRVGRWTDAAAPSPRAFHHVLEVAPGIVLSGSVPLWLLDARDDPTSPVLLAETELAVTRPATMHLNPHSLPARVAWPSATAEPGAAPQGDRYAVVPMETPFTGPCSDASGEVVLLDTADWWEHGAFRPVDRYRITTNGVFADGKPPHNVIGCGAYGLDTHPGWGADGRVAAVTFFEHGLRLLAVEDGAFEDVAGFLPNGGNSMAVRWLTDELLYVVDLHRGIDILRFTGAVGGGAARA
jgi:hypothetical protein